MSHTQRASKQKHRRKAVPPGYHCRWRAAHPRRPVGQPDMPTQNTGVSHEIILGEEEISDVSLATFYVFDKENAETL